MRVTFAVTELKARLAELGQVVARKSEEALYRNLRVFTDADGIVNLQGIDIDTTMTLKLPAAQADGAINVLVDFKLLNEVVPNLTDAQAAIAIKGETEAVLTSGKFRGRLTTYPTEKFLELPLVQGIAEKPAFGGVVFGLPGLKEQIDLVDFAIPAAEGRHVVASALIESTDVAMNLVATTGFVIAVSTTPSQLGAFSFVVPKPALDLVKKLDGGTTITISETEGAFFFQTELELVTYNKTHSEFPDVKRVIPKEPLTKVITITSKDELLATIARVKPYCVTTTEGKEKPINVEYDGEGSVSLVAVREDKAATGDTYTDMGFDSIAVAGSGGAFKIKLDINKFLPFVERAPFPITMHVTSAAKVVDFHGNGSTFQNPLYRLLVMPMRGVEGVSSSPIPVD